MPYRNAYESIWWKQPLDRRSLFPGGSSWQLKRTMTIGFCVLFLAAARATAGVTPTIIHKSCVARAPCLQFIGSSTQECPLPSTIAQCLQRGLVSLIASRAFWAWYHYLPKPYKFPLCPKERMFYFWEKVFTAMIYLPKKVSSVQISLFWTCMPICNCVLHTCMFQDPQFYSSPVSHAVFISKLTTVLSL